MANIHLLLEFFTLGRAADGTFLSAHEHIINASERRMSTWEYEKLLKLRKGALEFATMIENEIQARISDFDEPSEPEDYFRDAVEADADVLRSAGMGTDEDYGLFGGDSDLWGEF